MEGIKQRLFQILQRHSGEPFPVAVVEVLARDALAEIEELESIVQDVGSIAATDYGPAAVARIAERLRTRRV